MVLGWMAGEFLTKHLSSAFFSWPVTQYLIHFSVETHDEGRIIVFDDSRNHRAFCYGDGERVVLILDLERPDSLPMGTATG